MSKFVEDFYNANALFELTRLDLPLCRIEFATTLKLIEKYLPKKGKVCDIGGGTGRYSIEMAKRGFQVSLLDLSEKEINIAKEEFEKHELSAEQIVVGNAQDLSQFNSAYFDAGLLLGPMYHIVEAENRAKALQELRRVLKPNGVAIIAYLNSWGLMRTGINDFPSRFQEISFLHSMLEGKTFIGQALKGFTESYWSTPEIALQEVKNNSFEIISYAGAESFASGMATQLEKLEKENPDTYANILQVASETGELKQFRDTSDHLNIIIRKI